MGKLIRVFEGEAPSWPFEGDTLEINRKNGYMSDHRDRRGSQECGAHIALDDVVDEDIQSCLLTVIDATSDRLDIFFPHSACKFEAVKKYTRDREAVLREIAGRADLRKEDGFFSVAGGSLASTFLYSDLRGTGKIYILQVLLEHVYTSTA